jgi:hypothetical protein
MAEITVVRFEQYPSDEPEGWAVGFTVTCSNGRSFYVDTSVSFSEADNDEMAVEVALNKLRDQIESTVAMFESKSSVIGKKLNLSKEGGVEWI